ncbi:biotin synthase [Candidatus Magnetoovum chiemensis]|nr:biotin synthase [Candidatus Magnetoovum chiemensis]
MFAKLRDKVLHGDSLNNRELSIIIEADAPEVFELFVCANAIRHHYRSNVIDLCSITNAKSGGCGEDCAFCAQSFASKADIDTYPLKDIDHVLSYAKTAKENKTRRFCIVTAGKKVNVSELEQIAKMIKGIKALNLLPCATLGLLHTDELDMLKNAGLLRYHHNLETSKAYFPHICTTHTYADKIKTLRAARLAGLSLCSGGIFGMGETWSDRINMAYALKDLDVDSVPINFLTPIKGAPISNRKNPALEALDPIEALEALKIISLYRFILPDKEIRICGGRLQTLGELNSLIFMAGADGLLIGNYLTTLGRHPKEDLKLIKNLRLNIE